MPCNPELDEDTILSVGREFQGSEPHHGFLGVRIIATNTGVSKGRFTVVSI